MLCTEEESNETSLKNTAIKECDGDGKPLNDNVDSSVLGDLNATYQSDRNIEHIEESNKTSGSDKNDNSTSKSNEKMDKINMDNLESSNNQFNLIRSSGIGSLRTSANLSCDDNILNADNIVDNTSNISDSDVGDFPDDGNMDDSSNDSAKSRGSLNFVSHLTNKLTDTRPSDNLNKKDEPKNSNNDDVSYSVNFLDDLNSSESSDSNNSEKDIKTSSGFNLSRDCSKGLESIGTTQSDLDAQNKSSPNTDSKLKASSLSIVTSLESAIGSKNVEDDNTLLDLHTDNISDDEYDIKPESISIRNSENILVNAVRNNENFESIANYISPAPTSLNAIISADYSNLSDNNDTNSNENNRECNDNKRSDSASGINKAENSEQVDNSTRNANKDPSNSDNLIGLLETQDQSSDFSSNVETSNKNRSPFRIDSSAKDKTGNDKTQNDVLGSDNNSNKEDNEINASPNIKIAFSINSNSLSVNKSSANDNNSNIESASNTDLPKSSESGGETKNRSESTNKKVEDDLEFSLNFLDDHSMHDSNQSAILDNLIGDSNKGKNDSEMDQMLPTTSTSIAGLDLDSESLSQIIDSIKASSNSNKDDRKRHSQSNSPSNIGDGMLITQSSNQQSVSNSNQNDECFNDHISTYISPAREHHSMDAIDNTNEKINHSTNIDESNIEATSDIGKIFGSSSSDRLSRDNFMGGDTNKSRVTDLIKELEMKVECTNEFEQNPKNVKTEENNSNSTPSTTKKSSQSKSTEDSSKKSGESSKTKKYSDIDSIANKSTSSSNRSSKSSKKSKHGKLDSSSKKSSKASSKSEKSKPSNADSSKQNENTNTLANQMSSSKKTKENTSSKRILKPMKRPHRTICSDSMLAAKRKVYNYESIAALMNTPMLGNNQDKLVEYNDTPQMLYDFSTWEAWMNHPVKRFKPGETMSSRTVFKELQELYSKQNVRMVDMKKNSPNSVESKSISDGLQTSDEDVDQDYYNDSGSVSFNSFNA